MTVAHLIGPSSDAIHQKLTSDEMFWVWVMHISFMFLLFTGIITSFWALKKSKKESNQKTENT